MYVKYLYRFSGNEQSKTYLVLILQYTTAKIKIIQNTYNELQQLLQLHLNSISAGYNVFTKNGQTVRSDLEDPTLIQPLHQNSFPKAHIIRADNC